MMKVVVSTETITNSTGRLHDISIIRGVRRPYMKLSEGIYRYILPTHGALMGVSQHMRSLETRQDPWIQD